VKACPAVSASPRSCRRRAPSDILEEVRAPGTNCHNFFIELPDKRKQYDKEMFPFSPQHLPFSPEFGGIWQLSGTGRKVLLNGAYQILRAADVKLSSHHQRPCHHGWHVVFERPLSVHPRRPRGRRLLVSFRGRRTESRSAGGPPARSHPCHPRAANCSPSLCA